MYQVLIESAKEFQEYFNIIKKNPIIKTLLGKNKEKIQQLNIDVVIKTYKNLITSNHLMMKFLKPFIWIKIIQEPDFNTYVTANMKFFNKNETTVDDIKISLIDDIIESLKNINKELLKFTKGTISTATKNEIVNYINKNGGIHNLNINAQNELSNLEGIRPDKPIVLYRGLLFSSYDFKKRMNYFSEPPTFEESNGIKFLKSIRDNQTTVYLNWPYCAAWTYSKDTADRFATASSASSNFEATLGWLTKAIAQDKIDGDLGIVIATIARPEDILVDLSMVNISGKHGKESQVILKPGVKLSKIVKKYTRKKEVPPDYIDTSGIDILNKTEKFVEKLDTDALNKIVTKFENFTDDVIFHPQNIFNFTDEKLKQLIISRKEIYNMFYDIYKYAKEFITDIPEDLSIVSFGKYDDTKFVKYNAVEQLIDALKLKGNTKRSSKISIDKIKNIETAIDNNFSYLKFPSVSNIYNYINEYKIKSFLSNSYSKLFSQQISLGYNNKEETIKKVIAKVYIELFKKLNISYPDNLTSLIKQGNKIIYIVLRTIEIIKYLRTFNIIIKEFKTGVYIED